MVNVLIRLGNSTLEYDASPQTSVLDIKAHILKVKKLPIVQQEISILKNPEERKTVLKDNELVQEHLSLVKDNTLVLSCKNLGRQIEYQNLFYLEYLLPLLTLPLFYVLNQDKANSYHILLSILGFFHYAKRELETAFVHVFSYPSVPWANAWRNLLHYWIVFGIMYPIEIYYLRSMSLWYSTAVVGLLVGLFLLFELLNFYCHVQLRMLRYEYVEGKQILTKKRKIPHGLFFDSIVTPNYTFEAFSWIAFTVLSRSYVMIGFTVFSVYVMFSWARKKKIGFLKGPHYTEEQKAIVKKRFVMFPGL